MGGASLWLQTVTITPGGLAEFMRVPTGKAGTQQLDGQDLGERHPGIVPTISALVLTSRRWTELPLSARVFWPRWRPRERSGGTWRQ
jgi:hypothetical protein